MRLPLFSVGPNCQIVGIPIEVCGAESACRLYLPVCLFVYLSRGKVTTFFSLVWKVWMCVKPSEVYVVLDLILQAHGEPFFKTSYVVLFDFDWNYSLCF